MTCLKPQPSVPRRKHYRPLWMMASEIPLGSSSSLANCALPRFSPKASDSAITSQVKPAHFRNERRDAKDAQSTVITCWQACGQTHPGKKYPLMNTSSTLCRSHGFSRGRALCGTGHRGLAWAWAPSPLSLAAWADPLGARVSAFAGEDKMRFLPVSRGARRIKLERR